MLTVVSTTLTVGTVMWPESPFLLAYVTPFAPSVKITISGPASNNFIAIFRASSTDSTCWFARYSV